MIWVSCVLLSWLTASKVNFQNKWRTSQAYPCCVDNINLTNVFWILPAAIKMESGVGSVLCEVFLLLVPASIVLILSKENIIFIKHLPYWLPTRTIYFNPSSCYFYCFIVLFTIIILFLFTSKLIKTKGQKSKLNKYCLNANLGWLFINRTCFLYIGWRNNRDCSWTLHTQS